MRLRHVALWGALSVLVSGWAVLSVPSPGLASSRRPPQGDDGVLRVDTQLVQVTVVARDEDGRLPEDLSVDDFTILDDGVPQEIAVFEVTRAADGTEAEASPLPVGVRSNMRDWRGGTPSAATVVLVDRLNTPDDAQVFLNGHLEEFLASFDRPEHIALYELTEEFRPLHDFTGDPSALVSVASELEPYHSVMLASSDSNAGFEASLGTVGVDRELGDFLGGNSGRGQFALQSADFFLDSRVQTTLEALETIAHHLSGVPGRKNLVWLSGRFPFTFDPWNRTDLVEEIERSTVSWMEQVGFQLTRSNIAVYPVDVRGPSSDGGAEFNGVMKTIADMTGGRPYYGTNAAGEAITQAVDDARAVYTLGFYPSEPGESGDFRDVEVRVARDDVELDYRPGYYALSSSGGTELTWGVTEFLTSPLDATDITLVGTGRGVVEGAQGGFQLLVLAETADLNLRPEDGMRVGEIDLVALFQSAAGGLSILPAETIPISMTEEQYQQALTTGFLLQKTVDTAGNAGRVRMVVRDKGTGAAGSVWIPVGTPPVETPE